VTDTAEDFESFVASRQRALWRTAWLLTGDSGTAEDLVQTALVKSWPRWHRLAGTAGAEAYVRQVMFHEHVSWRRRRWHGERPSAVLPERAAAAPADPDVRDAVRQGLLALPPRQRAAVVLRYFEDLTEAQSAAVLGCSVGTVKSNTSRGLDRLRVHPGLADLLTEGASL
jgi:RNA polymerase sigma-70 factor (sigma-E family)